MMATSCRNRWEPAGRAAVTDVLARLLGRAPRTLDQFLEEYKDSFRSQAAGA
jgi:hypothetical protein